MTTLALALALVLSQVAHPEAEILRRTGTRELAAGRLESAQVLLAIAHWLAPDPELGALAEAALRALRDASAAGRGALELREISDSPYEGLVVRCPGPSRALRTGRKSSWTTQVDGESITIRGRSVRREREHPGEFESERVVLVTDDETLALQGRKLALIEPRAPGALAGRLLASADAREREAGLLLYPVRSTIRALERINDQRQASGVAPVGFSAELALACALHARYLAHERAGSAADAADHAERDDSPWYTARGARAGERSCVAPHALDRSVAQMLATLYHRVPLVEPGLGLVGLAEFRIDGGPVAVIDVISTLDPAPRRAVMVPGDGQTGVPVRFASDESPDPRPAGAPDLVGYPVTLSWYGGGAARGVLREAGGAEVECWVSTPEAAANAAQPTNLATICLLPKAPLRPATRYSATVEAGGTTRTWSFTTR